MKTGLFWGALVVALDRVSKIWAALALRDGSITVLPGVLDFTYAENTGMAFSLFRGYPRLLAIVSLALVCVVLFALRDMLPQTRLSRALQGMLLGGGVGNAIDRLAYGFVIDFIEPTFVNFAIFNVADVAVTLSAMALAAVCIGRDTEEKRRGTERFGGN